MLIFKMVGGKWLSVHFLNLIKELAFEFLFPFHCHVLFSGGSLESFEIISVGGFFSSCAVRTCFRPFDPSSLGVLA